MALVHNNKLYVANAGDSRCILCRSGKVVEMSKDHSPDVEDERNRIEAAGSKICSEGRINGGINLTRAIGNVFHLKSDNSFPFLMLLTHSS